MSPLWSSFSPSPSPIFIIILLFSSSLSRLSKWLGTELSPTILLDFPSVLDLATELDHRHHRGADNGATNGRCDQRNPGHGRWWLCGRKGGSEVREAGGWQGVVDSGATERVEDAKVYFFEHQSKETLKEKVYIYTWVWADLSLLDIHGFLAKIHKKQSCSGKPKLPDLSAATCRFPMIPPYWGTEEVERKVFLSAESKEDQQHLSKVLRSESFGSIANGSGGGITVVTGMGQKIEDPQIKVWGDRIP